MNPSQKPESLEPEIEVTRLFCEWRDGSATALEALTPLLYQELHRIAARYMQRERAEHTLQATALVNEAFLQIFIAGPDRVPAGSKFDPQDRVHFFALASRMMRRILVDHARAKSAQKRGGDRQRLSLEEAKLEGSERATDLEALDSALADLEQFDETKGRVIELRFFGGLTIEEVATVLELPTRRVWEETELAKAWLYRQLKER